MSKSYEEMTKDTNEYLVKLHKESSDVMQAFGQLSKAATKERALDKKTKELIALAIAVATRCDDCIGFHTKALVKLGVSRDEIIDVCDMSVYMGGGPSLMYASKALKAFEEFAQ